MMNEIRIKQATENDAGALWRMVGRQAEYEKLTEHYTSTEESLRAALFDRKPAPAEAIIAWAGDEPVGFAVFFPTFSTASATIAIWLEDLFVEEHWRGKGIGRKLMAEVARIAHERGYHSVNWSVLKWNEPAIGFYRRIGGEQLNAWHYFQLTGNALASLARER